MSFDGLKVPHEMLALSRELGTLWQEWALHGGEEYELLFAASKRFSSADVPGKEGNGLVQLGVFTDKHKDLLVRESGRTKKVPEGSWGHVTKAL